MRIGLTGGTGFIGQYLVRDYSNKHDFVVPFRTYRNYFEKKDAVRYIESDYSVSSLEQIFAECNAIIHLAGQKDLKKQVDCIEDIRLGFNVFEAGRVLEIPNIINLSTRAVWGNREHGIDYAIDEKGNPRPDSLYGLAKMNVEMLASYYNYNHNLHIKTYRVGEICGLDLSRGMTHVFWRKMLSSSIENKALPIYGSGSGGRDLIYVKDVTRALISGLEHGSEDGLFNIGRGSIITNLEIANVFCKVFSNHAGIQLYPELEDGGTDWYLRVEKAKNILDFQSEYDVVRIVEDIKEEYVKFESNYEEGL